LLKRPFEAKPFEVASFGGNLLKALLGLVINFKRFKVTNACEAGPLLATSFDDNKKFFEAGLVPMYRLEYDPLLVVCLS